MKKIIEKIFVSISYYVKRISLKDTLFIRDTRYGIRDTGF